MAHHHLRLVRLLFGSLLLFTACDSGAPAGPMDGDEDEDVRIGGAGFALTEGRTVQYTAIAGDGTRTIKTVPVMPTADVYTGGDTPVTSILTSCQAEGSKFPYSTACGVRSASDFFQVYGGPIPEDVFTLTCAGHKALEIAGAVGVTTLSSTMEVAPPNKSDQASWSLLAVEFLREATVSGASILPCINANLASSTTTADGQTIDYREYVTATIADASSSMMEAVDAAKEAITASAEAKLASAQDKESGTRQVWADRHDSKLELASVLGPISNTLYSETQLQPLYEYTRIDEVQGSSIHDELYSTLAFGSSDDLTRLEEFRYKMSTFARGYLLPYDLPQPAGSKLLATYRINNQVGRMITTIGDATWLATNVNAPVTLVRYEGWTLPAGTTNRSPRTALKVHDAYTKYPDYWGITKNTGSAAAGDIFYLADKTETFKNAGSMWPMASPPATADGQKHAEQLLRQTQVNPCSSGLAGYRAEWCQNVLPSARSKDDVAVDLLRAMGRYRKTTAPDPGDQKQMLADLGITSSDVAAAATRILDQAAVLGRPITLQAAPKITYLARLVNGTGFSAKSVEPAYLYARSIGRPNFSTRLDGYVTVDETVRRGLFYGRSSVYAALDYLNLQANMALAAAPSGSTSSTWFTNMKQSAAWSRQFLGASVRVDIQASATDGKVGRVGFAFAGLPLTQAQATDRCGLWLGEFGLDCALNPGSAACSLPVRAPTLSWATKTVGDDPQSWLEVSYLPGSGDPQVPPESRMYFACNIDGTPQVFAATTVVKPPSKGTETYRAYLPPFSRPLQQDLADILAADTEDSEMGAQSCAGIPRDVKLPLDDEITDALTGANDVESSFAHYLKLSQAAANEADALGEQLIEQGLQMDMRSEAARDELEDLCGGQINVPRIQKWACDPASNAKCDVNTLLAGALDSAPDEVKRDIEGLRDCLGEDASLAPVNASLGDQKMCAWQYKSKDQRTPTCVCPLEPAKPADNASTAVKAAWATADAQWQRLCGDVSKSPEALSCPSISGGTKCGDMFVLTQNAANSPADFEGFAYVNIDETLRVSVTKANTPGVPPPPKNGTTFNCAGVMRLRDGTSPELYKTVSTWATQSNLKNAADQIGYEQDLFGKPMLTVGGKPWITFFNGSGPMTNKSIGWPCGIEPLIDASLTGADTATGALCTSNHLNSLFCGGICGADDLPYRADQITYDVAERLRHAVVTLKAITGSSTSGVILRTDTWGMVDPRFDTGASNVLPASMRMAGQMPAWSTAAGRQYAVSLDGKRMCVSDASGAFDDCYALETYDHTHPDEQPWPKNPWFLYSQDTNTCIDYQESQTVGGSTVIGTLEPQGCGDMQSLLNGSTDLVNVKVVRKDIAVCPRVPASLCAVDIRETTTGTSSTDMLCGEALWTWSDLPATAPDAMSDNERNQYKNALMPILWQEREGNDNRLWSSAEEFYEFFGTQAQRSEATKHGRTLDGFPDVDMIATIDKALKHPELTADQRRTLRRARVLHLQWELLEVKSCTEQGSSKTSTGDVIGRSISAGRVLDALELACAQLMKQEIGCDTLLDKSYKPKDIDDFPTLSNRVRCAADRVEGSIEKMWMAGIPKDVAEGVRNKELANVFPTHRGQYGEEVAALATELEGARQIADGVVQALRNLKLEMDESTIELNKLDLQESVDKVDTYIEGLKQDEEHMQARISNIRTRQAISSNITTCVASVASSAGNWFKDMTGQSAGEMAASTATCANSAVQVLSELQIAGLQSGINQINDQISNAVIEKIKLGQRVTEEDKQIVLISVARQVNLALDKMNDSLHSLNEAYGRIQGHLAKLEEIRQGGRRAAAKVMMLGTDDMGRMYSVNTGMRARLNTLRVRYGRARTKAIQLSYLARRAVEQKFGVDLSHMNEDLLQVEAPSKWVDSLCTLTGIDYDKVREAGNKENLSYEDGYVGEWLNKLNAFVESYRVDYPFNAGSDLAVVSVRDELVNAYEQCDHEGWNKLYYTDGLFSVKQSDTSHGWEYSCAATGASAKLANAQATGDSPFVCGSASVDCATPADCALTNPSTACNQMGAAKAVLVSAASTGACDASSQPNDTGSGDGALPTGSFYRYRADSCSVSGGTVLNDTICTNLSGGSALKWTGGPVPVLKPDGIGGRSVIELPNGTVFGGGALQTPVTEYTMTWVFRKSPKGYALSNANQIAVNGKNPLSRMYFNNGIYHMATQNTHNVSPFNFQQQNYYALSRVPPQLKPRQGDIFTVRANKSGVEVWYNGVLRGRGTDLPAVPTTLGSHLAQTDATTGSDVLWLAESVAYPRSLTDSELSDLHGELAQYYAVDLDAPAYWLSGPSIEPIRTSSGDAVSGYLFSGETGIRDAANGQLPELVRGGVDTQPLVSFGGTGPRALSFDGVDDQLGFRVAASATLIRTDGAATEYPAVTANEYSVTMVANCQDGRAHRLFATNHVVAQAKLLLDVSATGQVLIRNAATGTVAASNNGEVTCGVPFVITLRGSKSLNSTEVFVNGSPVLSDPQFTAAAIAPSYGAGSATGIGYVYFKGQLAEAQVHLQAMSDDDIHALHRKFASSYNIPLAPDAGGGSTGGGTTITGPARMRQVVTVDEGAYWLSWYQKAAEAPLSVLVEYLDENTSDPLFTPSKQPTDTILSYADWSKVAAGSRSKNVTEELLATGWVRYFVQVNPQQSGRVGIGFVPGGTAVYLAAPQLERIDDWQSTSPEPYFPTNASLSQKLDKCEDEDGSVFRDMWHRGCEYYCPPGAGTDCAANGDVSNLPQRCFYELDFGISLEEIEKGNLIPEAGFARGNFNYRFDQLAVNLVGTAVKNCELSATPSSCYAGNFLQYSLYQNEPFRIRNYDGDAVRAPLPPGKIQQAKALLAERYLTNPLSGSDASLLGGYWRSELNGRPIDGNFKLRIYDADGLNFRALEDVQVALKYRYWTRSN